uniref:Uncharacterized protein n=1 Tax=Arundo donax TaxID=35708 RepID=A0A0A9C6E4_ARUDO
MHITSSNSTVDTTESKRESRILTFLVTKAISSGQKKATHTLCWQ